MTKGLTPRRKICQEFEKMRMQYSPVTFKDQTQDQSIEEGYMQPVAAPGYEPELTLTADSMAKVRHMQRNAHANVASPFQNCSSGCTTQPLAKIPPSSWQPVYTGLLLTHPAYINRPPVSPSTSVTSVLYISTVHISS